MPETLMWIIRAAIFITAVVIAETVALIIYAKWRASYPELDEWDEENEWREWDDG